MSEITFTTCMVPIYCFQFIFTAKIVTGITIELMVEAIRDLHGHW